MAQKVKSEIEELKEERAGWQMRIERDQKLISDIEEHLNDPSRIMWTKESERQIEGLKRVVQTYEQQIADINLRLGVQPEPLRKGSVPGIRGESFTPLKPLRKKSVSRIQRELFQPVPQRQETITSKGGEINLKDEIGATLSIPINSTARGEHVQVNLATGFRGTCEMPEGVESVSPAYLIKTTNEIEFREHVDIKLRHTSNLQTAEDCEEMVFLKANITQNDSNSRLHFEKIVDSDSVNFSPGERDGRLKLKKLFSWFKIGRKQSRNKKERFYSARLYRAVTGIKVTAIFCMCLEHPLYTKHCDKMIPLEYPDRAKQRTFFNQVIITSDNVDLVMGNIKTWTLLMDRSEISKVEVDRPECTKIKFSELCDYPPRIVIDLTPTEEASGPAVLKVMGLKYDRCFRIANDCVPNRPVEIDTQLLQDVTKELKTRISKDLNYDSHMVSCARDMVWIMTEVEQLVHDSSSISHLLKKVKEIQEQIESVIKLSKGVNDVESSITKVSMISQQFRTLTSVMQRCSAGNPELWSGAVDVLVTNATNLMKAITELLKATEIAVITERTRCHSASAHSHGSVSSYASFYPPHQQKSTQPSLSGYCSVDFGSPPPCESTSPLLKPHHSVPPPPCQTAHLYTYAHPPQAKHTLVEPRHYGILCQQLRPCAAKWREIALGLRFYPGEIDNILADPMKMMGAPLSYMDAVISVWMNRCPGDDRGSTDVATLEELVSAVNSANCGSIAHTLTIPDY